MIDRDKASHIAPSGEKTTDLALEAGGDPPQETVNLDASPLTPCPSPEYERGEPSPVPARSSLVGAAVSLAASLARFAASGFKTVDEPLHQLRMSHCSRCEYRRDSQCALCRCFIAKKAWLPHEDCPIGRWTS